VSRALADLDPSFRPYAEALVSAARSLAPTQVTSTRRSWSDQARLYVDYLQGKRALPALPPERSLHVWGYAVDLVCGAYKVGGPPSPEMAALGDWWRKAGGRWGGAADPVHYSA
jgi:hypothetical protein